MAFDAKNKVAIVGVGHSKLGRHLDRPTGLLAVDACRTAVEDAGLKMDDIDGICVFPQGPAPGVGPVPGKSNAQFEWMIDALGIKRLNYWATGGGNISTAVGYAILALSSHMCDYALVWRAMYQPRGGQFGSGSRNRPREAPTEAPNATGGQAYTLPYGQGDGPTGFAAAYMRHMKMYGAKREDMAAYILAARAGANKNPHSVFYNEPLSFEDYMSARWIAEPMCLYDCDMPIDGAGAIVLTRSELAKDMKQKPAYITALGSGAWDWRKVPPEEYENNAANIGKTLWASTDMKPKDMDGAMLYEGFSPDIWWWLEGLGFCGMGEAHQWTQDGRIELGGELPINTFGGAVSEGRLHGIGHWIEATKQIQGRADDKPGDGARQIKNAENILCVTGMTGHGMGAILSKDPR